jgi:hypothetical protein
MQYYEIEYGTRFGSRGKMLLRSPAEHGGVDVLVILSLIWVNPCMGVLGIIPWAVAS